MVTTKLQNFEKHFEAFVNFCVLCGEVCMVFNEEEDICSSIFERLRLVIYWNNYG